MISNLSALLLKKGMFESLDSEVHIDTLKDGENRFITILFADVKGFTAMSEKLDHEIVQHLLDQLMISFSEIIHKYSGYVDKYEGDRIMAHFGSLAFLEQNSRRAVYAGLELIDIIIRFNQLRPSIPELAGLDVDLAIRVGINSGMAATGRVGIKREGDFTVYGDAVNLASRMEENGVPLKVMVPLEVKEELEEYFDFEYNTDIHVKGKSKPISTWLVQGINHSNIARKLSKNAFIARENELKQMENIYEKNLHALQSNTALKAVDVIGISAAAGIGKTRLIREFYRDLPADSVFHLEVSPICQSPFASFTGLLHRLFGFGIDTDLDVVLQSISDKMISFSEFLNPQLRNDFINAIPYIAYIAGVNTGSYFNSENREELAANLNQSLLLLIQGISLRCAARGQILVLIFDDLHFCEESSLNAISYIIKNTQRLLSEDEKYQARVMFILSWRDNYIIGNLIPPQVCFQEIALKELDHEQINLFIEQAFPGQTIPKHVRELLIDNSDGNPLFLEEWIDIVQMKIASGETIDFEALSVPQNIKVLILSRLNSFDKISIRLVQDASTIGVTFQKSILNQLEINLNSCADPGVLLQHLIDLRFIESSVKENEDTEYFFRHQLLHQAVYDTILAANKRILHRMIAEIIENTFQDVITQWYFSLADHYIIAKNTQKSIFYVGESEKLASSLFMNKKALEFCDKLLTISAPEEHQKIRLRKASYYLDMGQFLKADEILETLEPSTFLEPESKDDYFLAKVRILLNRSALPEAQVYLETNLTLFSSKFSLLKAKICLIDILRLSADATHFLITAEQLLSEVKETPDLLTQVENIIGLFHQNHGNYIKAIEYYDRAIIHAGTNKGSLRRALHNKANSLSAMGRKTEALESFDKALNLARFLDDDALYAKITCDLGMIRLDLGDFEKALKMLNESYCIAVHTGNVKLQIQITYNRAVYYLDNNDLIQARKFILECLVCSKRISDLASYSQACDLLGDILFQEGKYSTALRIYERNLKIQNKLSDFEGIAHTYGNIGNVAAIEGDDQKAASYYQKQLQILVECGDIEGQGKAWFNWGILDAENNRTADAIQKVSMALKLFQEGNFELFIPTVQDYLDELREKEE